MKAEKLIKVRWFDLKKDYSFVQKKGIKERIKSIPFAGKLIWTLYGILKAPERIANLFLELEAIKNILIQIKEEKKGLQRSIKHNSLRIDTLYEEFSFIYNRLPEYVVMNFPDEDVRDLFDEDELYDFFEERFRGDIKDRLKKYIDIIKEIYKGGIFLDIGCGRGEFLFELKKAGIRAKGIDKNKKYVKELQEKGYDVEYADAIEYLSGLEDNSISGASAIQVIEHLEFEELKKMIFFLYKKVSKNGIIILETVNPKSSIALSNFYLDYTHKRPYPFELIAFLCSIAGFKDLKIIFSSPVEKHFKTSLLEANYMDYAVVGYKI